MKKKNLFFIPFDRGSDILGAAKGPLKIFDTAKAKKEFPFICNETFCNQNDETFSLESIKKEVYPYLNKDVKNLFISGDHSITYYIYQIVREHFNCDIPIIVFDAHSDSSLEYENWINHGCFFRELIKKVKPEIYHIGVRYDPMKLGDIDEMSFPSFSFLQDYSYVKEIIKQKIGDRPCYVSIDVDVLDPQFCPAVNFPVSGGLKIEEFFSILDSVFSLNVIAADLVEYVPQKDINSKSLIIIKEIIRRWLRD